MSQGDGPLLPDVGVLGLVPEAWGDVWMPRHQVMSRLARYFQVLWLDPALGWREALRARGARRKALNPQVPDLPGFHLWSPGALFPTLFRPRRVATVLRRMRVREAVRRLKSVGAERTVLYLWRPEFEYALDAVPDARACYHVDDEYSFSTSEQPVSEREARLLGRVDHAFLHSPGLWEKKAHLATAPAFVPNGVDYESYARPEPEPADLRGISHPRIGYVGVVKHFLNIPLLLELALRRPDYSLVIVGPVKPMRLDQEYFNRLAGLPNVHLLGARPVERLPAYTQHLDVGIMPYDLDGYTKFIYPLKLHEYLAAGLPVVASPIRTLQDFNGIITLARGIDEWTRRLAEAVSPANRDASLVAERKGVARTFDWDRIAHRVAMALAEGLGRDAWETVVSAPFAEEDWMEIGGDRNGGSIASAPAPPRRQR